jgi:hypothetical protein
MNHTNRQGLEEVEFSEANWRDLLSISHRYECDRARKRSIKEINDLNPPVDNADMVAMSRKFEVEEWLLPACVALVERQDPLSYTEAEKLGLSMTVLLSEAREKYIQSPAHNQQPNENATRLVKEVLHIS